MDSKKIGRQMQGKLLEFITITVFGIIVAFAKGLSAFEILFPGNPSGSGRGDDES